jgi:FKBP-type peptidyl-prolyl cis-trans isomerase FkpA
MMIKSRWAILFILIPALIMCSRKNENPLTPDQIREAEEALVHANRALLKKDKARIIEYIDNHNLALKETQSGLWFEIIRQGEGPEVKEGMQISIDYQVSLLDGTICYRSDSLGYKVFRTGQGGVESGIDEGIRMLREGSDAIFILPPHLAHGLTGDSDCIPPRSVIVYHIKVIKVDP